MNVAMIIAGGSGARMGQDIPKQFISVNDIPVIVYTLQAFERHPEIDEIAVVCIEDWIQVLWAYARQFGIGKLKYVVPGGDTGQESIRNGVFELEKYYNSEDIVLIHDSIRPMVSYDGAVSTGTYDRNSLKRTQTPQAFHIGDICELHRRAIEKGIKNSVASCTLMIEMGEKVFFSKGSEKNIKLTTVEDIDIFKALLAAKRAEWLK